MCLNVDHSGEDSELENVRALRSHLSKFVFDVRTLKKGFDSWTEGTRVLMHQMNRANLLDLPCMNSRSKEEGIRSTSAVEVEKKLNEVLGSIEKKVKMLETLESKAGKLETIHQTKKKLNKKLIDVHKKNDALQQQKEPSTQSQQSFIYASFEQTTKVSKDLKRLNDEFKELENELIAKLDYLCSLTKKNVQKAKTGSFQKTILDVAHESALFVCEKEIEVFEHTIAVFHLTCLHLWNKTLQVDLAGVEGQLTEKQVALGSLGISLGLTHTTATGMNVVNAMSLDDEFIKFEMSMEAKVVERKRTLLQKQRAPSATTTTAAFTKLKVSQHSDTTSSKASQPTPNENLEVNTSQGNLERLQTDTSNTGMKAHPIKKTPSKGRRGKRQSLAFIPVYNSLVAGFKASKPQHDVTDSSSKDQGREKRKQKYNGQQLKDIEISLPYGSNIQPRDRDAAAEEAVKSVSCVPSIPEASEEKAEEVEIPNQIEQKEEVVEEERVGDRFQQEVPPPPADIANMEMRPGAEEETSETSAEPAESQQVDFIDLSDTNSQTAASKEEDTPEAIDSSNAETQCVSQEMTASLPIVEGEKYVAIFDYVPQQGDEIEIREFDVLNVKQKGEDGWFKGYNVNTSQEGLFPGNYCQKYGDQVAQ